MHTIFKTIKRSFKTIGSLDPMKVSNIMMFEFNSADSLEVFVDAWKAHGPYLNTEHTVFVKTGETCGVGITLYENEKSCLAGYELSKKGLQTDNFSKH